MVSVFIQARGLYQSDHGDSQEAELRASEGRAGASDQRHGGDGLHSGRRTYFAGALGCGDPRRPGKGFAGCALPYSTGSVGYDWSGGEETAEIKIRSKKTQKIMRRKRNIIREIAPDTKYGNVQIAKFINYVMRRGKKSVAQKVVYSTFDMIEKKYQQDPLVVFDTAIKNVSP